jgi:hypothetical protein
MRFAITRAAFLGSVFALASLAQQQLSVTQVVDFVTSSVAQKMLDRDVADVLSKSRLTEKLDTRLVQDLQSKGAGPKTVAALLHLAELSASLTPPAPQAAAPKAKPIPAPSAEEQQQVLDAAREYALNYAKSLPDFICLEVNLRYIDRHYKPDTEGSWAMSDKIAEKLTFYDQKEKYELISHNEDSLYGKSTDSVGGALSRGDFGTLIREIFEPESSAEFHWERWSNLEGHLMSVYTFYIDQPHSHDTIDYNRTQQVTAAYHGEVFVEKGANTIWRINVVPEPPPSFPVQNIKQRLDYRYTDISGQKFLLPVSGQVIMKADGTGTKNEIQFRSYRKYSADTSITFDDSDTDTPPQAAPGKETPGKDTPPKP